MRIRLIVNFAIIVLVTISIMLFIATIGTANEVRSYMFRGGMYGASRLIKDLQGHYRAVGSWDGIENFFISAVPGHMMGNHPRILGMGPMQTQRLVVTDANGVIIADSSGEPPSGRITPGSINQALPIVVGDTTVGFLITEGGMVFSEDDESFLVGRLMRAAVVAGLTAGTFSLLLALILANRLLRPVQALTQAAERLGQGDLSQRARIHGNDELTDLGRTFNFMAESLENAELSRKALTADIAHELRTPLAVQRANLEALQDGVYPLTADNLQPILQQNLLLTRLVDDLRTIALVEGGALELQTISTDFLTLVKKVMEQFQPQAAANEIRFSLITDPGIKENPVVVVDPIRVEQIISNLLSNACRYTPENGTVELSMQKVNAVMQLSVHDSGAGIPPDSLPYIFERFYRADRSRSREEGGSGLGLAIARKLAEAHGGTLSAANHPAGGAIFTLSLPIGAKNPLSEHAISS